VQVIHVCHGCSACWCGAQVRAAAVQLVAEVYRLRKSSGQPFDAERMLGAGVKPALLAVLHKRFAEVDGEIAAGVVPGAAPAGSSSGGGGANPADEVPVSAGAAGGVRARKAVRAEGAQCGLGRLECCRQAEGCTARSACGCPWGARGCHSCVACA
jgi:hypothetical protein